MTQQRRLYTVKGRASHGSITHLCPTADLALDTMRRFQREAVQDILLLDQAGLAISPADLEAIVLGDVSAKPAVVTT